ncbi:hypothetical protein QBZ16_000309 [Prototheca wickerhamii]|uniref:cDENN domain-containing protein n=1 Tax=Prototheca wickerhamii TaxID=3111 RepID=A0AAD9IMK9_PROWI|nr:hypothetical protein QBZ16_000309 [Prototheca wickerhamii]
MTQERAWGQRARPAFDPAPSDRLFEHFVVVGLPHTLDVKAASSNIETYNRLRGCEHELGGLEVQPETSREARGQVQHGHRGPHLAAQVLHAWPPLTDATLAGTVPELCFPNGVRPALLERTPSMSELAEVVCGRAHLASDAQSFVFALRVTPDAGTAPRTLWGVCGYMRELVHRPPALLAARAGADAQALPRYLVTAPRCYLLLTHYPFFSLHFRVLQTVLGLERLDTMTSMAGSLTAEQERAARAAASPRARASGGPRRRAAALRQRHRGLLPGRSEADSFASAASLHSPEKAAPGAGPPREEASQAESVVSALSADESFEGDTRPLLAAEQPAGAPGGKAAPEGKAAPAGTPPRPVLARADVFSPQPRGVLPHMDEAAGDALPPLRVTNRAADPRGVTSRAVLEAFYAAPVPRFGQELVFSPDDALQAIAYRRSALARARRASGLHGAAAAAGVDLEAAENLGAWTIPALCRCMSLDGILTFLSAALQEAPTVVFCPNLGLLSAVVLSLVPLLLPFGWQSLLLPVMPSPARRLELLDAPVPFVVGVQYKTPEVSSRCSGLVRVNVRWRARTPELRALGRLTGAAHRPAHEVSDAQAALAGVFLSTVQTYLRGLVADLHTYTITDVSASAQRTSILLKEPFVEASGAHARQFMAALCETQLFAVYCDAALAQRDRRAGQGDDDD